MAKKKSDKTPKVKVVNQEDKDLVFSGKAGPPPDKKKVYELYKNGSISSNFKRWWDTKDVEKIHLAVIDTIDFIQAAQTPLRRDYFNRCMLYGNYQPIGLTSLSNDFNAMGGQDTSRRVVFNVVQSCVDAVTAKIAKDQPRVTFVTNGAEDFMKKVKVERLTKFVNAVMKSAGVYNHAEGVFRNGAVLGNGYLKLFREDGKIKSELVNPFEVIVDYADGMRSDPRSMHQLKLVPRDMLMIAYRDDDEKCRKIQTAQTGLQGKLALSSTVDLVEVIESWHLPTNKTSGDGLHAICIDNCTLMHEEYTKDYFPIVTWRWMPNDTSFFGRSITEEIADKQMEIINLTSQIISAIELIGVPMILVADDAEIPIDHLASNYIARIIKFKGVNPPTVLTPQAQQPEVYQYLQTLIQQCYQQVGLSDTSAFGVKPAGVQSGVALRTVEDLESGRFVMVNLRWEQQFVHIGKMIVDLARDEMSENENFSVKYTEDKNVKELKFADVNLDGDDCEISVFPTSQLPDSPAGRLETVEEYFQLGIISKERMMELCNLDPDLESEINLQTSSLRLTEKWLSDMVEDGIYHAPEPLMNLQLAQSMSQNYYAQLLIENCPEDRLELVRRFIQACIDMMTPPAPPPGAPPGPMPGQPPSGPGAPAGPPMAPPQQ